MTFLHDSFNVFQSSRSTGGGNRGRNQGSGTLAGNVWSSIFSQRHNRPVLVIGGYSRRTPLPTVAETLFRQGEYCRRITVPLTRMHGRS
ncbi:hypothetical protein MTO96_030903 [Rhipicephalus appendiculatus]